ncbi:MAG: hypothetical protein EAZ27_03130 [Cytophagales bacterium]|nr:MAG: hypothetical protein EAZ27_03130 [Cytophagales bacterium]
MISKILTFILHPDLQKKDNSDNKKATVFAKGLLLVLIFNTIYSSYYYFFCLSFIQNISNLIGLIIVFITFILLKTQKKIKVTFLFLVTFIFPLIAWGVFFTGGIYSTNLIWFLVLCIVIFFYIGRKEGIFFSILIFASYIILLFFTYDKDYNSYFLNYLQNQKPGESFLNILFASIFCFVMMYIFVKSDDEFNRKIKLDNENKVIKLNNKITERTKEIIDLRINLARDFHDEMGNKLAGINLLTQILAEKLENNSDQEIEQILQTIVVRSDELFLGTKDFIWSIDTQSDIFENMIDYIKDFGEDFFSKLNINFQCNMKLDLDKNKIYRIVAGRQMVSIAKELMTNIAKHAKATNVVFETYIKNDNLILIFKDNGIGFKYNGVRKNGINNINERIKILHGNIFYENSKEIGTLVKVEIPYKIDTI